MQHIKKKKKHGESINFPNLEKRGKPFTKSHPKCGPKSHPSLTAKHIKCQIRIHSKGHRYAREKSFGESGNFIYLFDGFVIVFDLFVTFLHIFTFSHEGEGVIQQFPFSLPFFSQLSPDIHLNSGDIGLSSLGDGHPCAIMAFFSLISFLYSS